MSTSFETAKTLSEDAETDQPGVSTRPVAGASMEAVESPRPAAVGGGMFAPFKTLNFSLLFSGQTISSIGDAFYAVALPFLIFNNGGNAQELGIVLTAYGVPRVGSVLLGGWLSDKLRPHRLMLLADVMRALLVGILAVLAFRGHPGLWLLCAVSFPLGAFQGLFLPASVSILPEILANDDLQAGNALVLISMQATMLIGSALAGVIVARLHSGPALTVDALTFVVSALSLALMRTVFLTGGQVEQQMPDKNGETLTPASPKELISLRSFLRTSRLVQVTFLFVTISNFCFGGLAEVALPALANGLLAVGANGYGLIVMAIGAGALTGSIVAGTMSKMPRKGLIGLLVSLIQALALMLIPYGGLAGAITFVFIASAVSSFTYTLLMTVIQLNLPRHLMGRIMGIFMFASLSSFPISTVLAGVLTVHFGPAILFLFSGLVLILAIFLGLIQRGLREL